ncbi:MULTISPECIES: MarR family transcriptional regulator [unclassified Paenibacillus]|uniref:MarR family winged helix-turn-helix transcriptional regulator n=1 Tax=unclassified Paenibacillus TaxID=185978 RepID=UPI001AEA5D9B|nr:MULTISPECIES: MarR family transcriptional regulator [unclassified Paenibacillus]MBP1154682.1 DNA-binding MarR family transcriptional regulator [Paenibacillus sp. PvP091]MBP1169934.1 DNA-binding MarR family transcriptional regulator [Paenibacillus sp. PvR098]MBP2440962.1 DNA-binding MarR family transcriptional regulator [Paenibacillus sp. PvP052]
MTSRQDLYELEETFRQLFRRIKASWSRFEEQGVSASQAVILEKLDSEGPLKVSQIAEALWITSGAVTTLSDKLIAGGFAERMRSEEDRRVVMMEITDKGKEVISALKVYRKKVVEAYFGELPEEDVQHLNRIFNHILNREETL